MKTLRAIIKDFGGAEEVSKTIEGAPSYSAIIKWYVNGIPEKYWQAFIEREIASIQELHFLNQMARKGMLDSEDLKLAVAEVVDDPKSYAYYASVNSISTLKGFFNERSPRE